MRLVVCDQPWSRLLTRSHPYCPSGTNAVLAADTSERCLAMLRSFGNRGFQLIQRGHEWSPDQRKAGVRSAGFSESERRPDLPVTAPTKISSLCWRPSGCGYFRLFCVILITLAAQSQYPALLPSWASAPQGCCRRSRRREDDSRRRKIAASYARFSSDLQDAKS